MNVKARMQGKLVALRVSVGDSVKAGDILGIFEAIKMEQPIPCPGEGTVRKINADVGDRISAGQTIIVIE